LPEGVSLGLAAESASVFVRMNNDLLLDEAIKRTAKMTFTTDKLVPVTITPLAAGEIRKIMEDKHLLATSYGLRVGIKGGGCGGASFLLGFDTCKEGDDTFQISGIPVYVDRKHIMYLLGLEIDFEDGNNGRGFTFNNPEVPRPEDAAHP